MNLNIIPNGAIKRVHVSQNDVGRTLTFELFNNSTQYTVPVGATVKIQGTKPSGFGFSETCTVSGNIVTVDTTETMTDEHGYIDTELQITYSGNTIGTSNFVLAVERNPHPDTTTDGSMETIIPELTLLVNEVKGYAEEIEGTYHAYGSPWVASTVAQMTDTDKIYVYTGSESGYVNGNWYYYNGTAWVSGGVYNAVAVQTDTTLSVSGMPADAKVVGDEINNVQNELNEYSDIFTSDVDESVQNWLDAHPEATTTVVDGSLTEAKFSDALKLKTIKDYVTPEMFGAKGDGVTDDLTAFQNLNGRFVILKRDATYYIETDKAYIFNANTVIIGNGATIKILFTGQNAPRVFYSTNGAKFYVNDCTFDVSIDEGASRSRVFDVLLGSAKLENVSATVNKVPGVEEVSFAEVNKLYVNNCNIVNDSECTTDGGTLWAKGTDSELVIQNSYISGNHNDEVIANYGSGSLRTKLDNCKVITSSKITLRALTDTTAKSFASLNNCDITYTENVMALDVGGKSTNNISLSHCVFHGTVSYILETSSFSENPITCYVNDCDFDDITYTRFVDATLAISLYMNNTNVGYLMSNPSIFRLKKIALNNCHVAETFLIDATSSATSETLSIDLWLNNCVIDTVHHDSKTRTADNPHLMINAFIGGTHINRYI